MRREVVEEVAQPGRPVDRERHVAVAERERLQHPRQAEVVVAVEVREEDLAQVDEADRRAQQLALRPLAAVEEQPVAAAADEQRGGERRAVGALPEVPRKTTSRSTAADRTHGSAGPSLARAAGTARTELAGSRGDRLTAQGRAGAPPAGSSRPRGGSPSGSARSRRARRRCSATDAIVQSVSYGLTR